MFCGLLLGLFQLKGENSTPFGLFETTASSTQETTSCFDSSDFVVADSIVEEVSEDVDSEVGILRKKSELRIFRIPHFVSVKRIASAPLKLFLHQHYTNLPPPTEV